MSEIDISSKVKVEITPEILAQAFWYMDSEKQADFFDALAFEVELTRGENPKLYGLGEMQWSYLYKKLMERGGKGLSMYHALSVFAFEFSQDHCGFNQKAEVSR